MPIYIIRPKTNLLSQSLNLATIKLNPESRQKQIQELNHLQQEDKNYQEVSRWTEYNRGKEGLKVLKSVKELTITGSPIIQMSKEEAEKARKDLGQQAKILEDGPLRLIHPIKKDPASLKREGEITDEDIWHLEKIKLIAVRKNKLEVTGKNITIAVLDTGIDSTHPALEGKVTATYTFNREKWLPEKQTQSLDTEGHGTHVAALICGKKIGVAPEAKLVNGILIPNGTGMIFNFPLAIELLIREPSIQIVNISAGVREYQSDWEEFIDDFIAVGVLPICAIGNEGRNTSRSPGNFNSVLSVGASNNRDRISSFSGSATFKIKDQIYNVPHLVAPGEKVYSAVTGGYEAWDGTSMATPIVSGIAALYLEKYPDLSVLDLKEELLDSCFDLGKPQQRQGQGLIQINI